MDLMVVALVHQVNGGTITNANLNGGSFTQYNGQITMLNLNSGTFTQQSGTIENITLTAAPTSSTQAATLQASESSSGSGSQTFSGSGSSDGQSSTTTDTIATFQKGTYANSNGGTNTGTYSGLVTQITKKADGTNTVIMGDKTITAQIKAGTSGGLRIDNQTGELHNESHLDTFSIELTPTGRSSLFATAIPTVIYNGEKGYISNYEVKDNAQIINNGKIGTLTLKEDNNNITNNPKYDENGKLINGIIENLVMTGGSNSINTLDGVAYNANTGMSTLDLQGGTLAVDTLSVGLNGNVAKHRIDLSSSSGNKNGTLSVKNIEVAYVDGNFNPTKHINTDLKSYVNNGDSVTSQLDTSSATTFRSSEQLQNLGITFNADGTPLFKVEDSIAADMTSLLIRQSMRRKMLIDTYLAEQSRRSLKNKERRTKQRIEANVLAQSKEQYEKDLAAYKQDKAKWDKLASSKENKALIAQYEKEYKAYEKAFKQYEKDKAKWEKLSDKDKAKLADKSKAPIAPIEPKAPTKPTAKEGDKDYKQVMADFDKAQKEHKKALSQYQKALKQYQKDKAKWEKLSDKDKAKLAKSGKQAPIAPKEPTQPAILAQEPIMPIAPELHSSLESLYADAYGIKGDFFIRAFGGMGEHRLNDGTQTNSWSAGTLLGANWNLKFGNSQGNIGFYGGYEYLHNGYKRVDINAQGNTGFVGLRFSHLFAQTKLAGFYYVADVNGGYSDFMIAQTYVGMPYSARLGNINIGASMRLGSALYLNKGKSILFPSLGVGFEGANIGEFELKTTAKENQLRSGGLSRSYAVAYAQANLNYYQEYGKRFSTTLGGGFRYLLNNEVEIAPTVNGIVFNANQQTGKIASVELAPFFYQGTFMVNYHTDNAGNFSVGYVAVGGLLGITHNASMRWHYFF